MIVTIPQKDCGDIRVYEAPEGITISQATIRPDGSIAEDIIDIEWDSLNNLLTSITGMTGSTIPKSR